MNIRPIQTLQAMRSDYTKNKTAFCHETYSSKNHAEAKKKRYIQR